MCVCVCRDGVPVEVLLQMKITLGVISFATLLLWMYEVSLRDDEEMTKG